MLWEGTVHFSVFPFILKKENQNNLMINPKTTGGFYGKKTKKLADFSC